MFVFCLAGEADGKTVKKGVGTDKKVQGFDRGLTPERIIGATDTSGIMIIKINRE